MTYLKTKAQFDNLNEFEKRDVLVAIHSLHSSHIWVSIELKNPPKGILASRVYCTTGVSSNTLSEYVRTNSSIVKQVVEVTKIKSFLV